MAGRQTQRMVAFALGLLCTSCSDASESSDDIEVGFLYSTEGFFGAFDPLYVDAARLAAEQINEAGGVQGRRLRVVPRDYVAKTDRAADLARELLDDGAVALIGPLLPPYIDAVASISAERKKPTFTLSFDAKATDTPYVFRMLGSQADHVEIISKRAMAAGELQMHVVHDASLSQSAKDLAAFHRELGGEPFEPLALESADAQTLLSSMLADPPDAIALLATPKSAADFLNSYIRSYANAGVFFRLWPTLCLPDLGAAVPGIEDLPHEAITAAFQAGGGAYDAFKNDYHERFPDNQVVGTLAFDAMFTLALAIEATGNTDGESLWSAIPEATSKGKAYDFRNFKNAREAAARGDDINYQGTSHPFDFKADGTLTQDSALFVTCTFGEGGKQQLSTKTLKPSDDF